MMLILASAAPYVSWGEDRAKLLRQLIKDEFGREISSYQIHKMLIAANVDDISVAYLKKLLGDSGKNHIASSVALDKALELCKVLKIEPKRLIPIFEIDAPQDFIDPIY